MAELESEKLMPWLVDLRSSRQVSPANWGRPSVRVTSAVLKSATASEASQYTRTQASAEACRCRYKQLTMSAAATTVRAALVSAVSRALQAAWSAPWSARLASWVSLPSRPSATAIHGTSRRRSGGRKKCA